MVLGFFEETEGERSWDNNDNRDNDDNDNNNNSNNGEGSTANAAERKAFWESQDQLLQEALARTSTAESRIRADTEEAVRNMLSGGFACSCANRGARDCRNCSLRHIADRLRAAGYNSALCRSKWRRSPDIPSGEHSYVDVVVDTKNAKKGPTRIVIELNFRAEFEMARVSIEYSGMVSRLPQIFVGRLERLKNIVKIMCEAAKQCMKENRMHMGPWRKHKYMQSKWLTAPERIVSTDAPLIPAAAEAAGRRVPKSRASMLTFDLHCTAVEVV
ncbi:hypothetical protein ACMD2_26294 [Ananas comosus]|nr:hypothetical protein ACMD2_26294 [Ananas comosus]